ESRSIAGRNRPVRPERWFECREHRHGGVGTGRLVAIEGLDALAPLDGHGSDLGHEFVLGLSGAETLLGTGSPPILCLAGDLASRHKIFGVPTGMLTREGIVEPVPEHAVVDLRIPHAITPAACIHEVGRAIHVLHSARDRRIDMTKPNFLRGASNGLRTRSAD